MEFLNEPWGIPATVALVLFALWAFGPSIKNNAPFVHPTAAEYAAGEKRADVVTWLLIALVAFGALALTGVFSDGFSVAHFLANMDYINHGGTP